VDSLLSAVAILGGVLFAEARSHGRDVIMVPLILVLLLVLAGGVVIGWPLSRRRGLSVDLHGRRPPRCGCSTSSPTGSTSRSPG
jgi:hypothetical protein